MTNYQTDVFSANTYARVKSYLGFDAMLERDVVTIGQAIERNEDEEMKSFYDRQAELESLENDNLKDR